MHRHSASSSSIALVTALAVILAGLEARVEGAPRKKPRPAATQPAAADKPAGGEAGTPPAAAPGPAAPAPAAPSPAAAAEAATPPPPAGSSGQGMDFDLFGDQKAAPSAEDTARAARIERLGRIRRGMLTAHQTVGFVTLALLTATVIVGQLNYYDRYISRDYTQYYQTPHLLLSVSTSTLFGATGLLALFAPNPYPKPVRFDSALVHKVAMALATAGMVTQLVLGLLTTSHIGRIDQPDLALGHLVTGYATWAFMATGVIAYVF